MGKEICVFSGRRNDEGGMKRNFPSFESEGNYRTFWKTRYSHNTNIFKWRSFVEESNFLHNISKILQELK